MAFAIAIVIVIMVVGTIGTLLLAGKGDEKYSSSAKGNMTRLTLIYVVLAIILIIGLSVFVYLK